MGKKQLQTVSFMRLIRPSVFAFRRKWHYPFSGVFFSWNLLAFLASLGGSFGLSDLNKISVSKMIRCLCLCLKITSNIPFEKATMPFNIFNSFNVIILTRKSFFDFICVLNSFWCHQALVSFNIDIVDVICNWLYIYIYIYILSHTVSN